MEGNFEIKEIQTSFSFTQNLGNYNSAKMNAAITVSVPPGTTPEQVKELYVHAWTLCMEQVRERRTEILQKSGGQG